MRRLPNEQPPRTRSAHRRRVHGRHPTTERLSAAESEAGLPTRSLFADQLRARSDSVKAHACEETYSLPTSQAGARHSKLHPPASRDSRRRETTRRCPNAPHRARSPPACPAGYEAPDHRHRRARHMGQPAEVGRTVHILLRRGLVCPAGPGTRRYEVSRRNILNAGQAHVDSETQDPAIRRTRAPVHSSALP